MCKAQAETLDVAWPWMGELLMHSTLRYGPDDNSPSLR